MDHPTRLPSLSDSEYLRSPHATRSPKLPGAEKFRFADHSPSTTTPSRDIPDGVFLRGASSRKTCPAVLSTGFNRSDSKRKPVLPISCQKTGRMLTLTNRPLSVDSVDVRSEEPVVTHRRSPLIMLEHQDDHESGRTSNKRISLPINVEAHLGRSPDTMTNGRQRFVNNNYKMVDIHRLSTSSCGSSVSEEDIWLPRKPNI